MYSPMDVLNDLQGVSFFNYSSDYYGLMLKDDKIIIDTCIIPLNYLFDIIRKAEESDLLLYLHYDDERRSFFLTWRHIQSIYRKGRK